MLKAIQLVPSLMSFRLMLFDERGGFGCEHIFYFNPIAPSYLFLTFMVFSQNNFRSSIKHLKAFINISVKSE